MPFPKPVGFQKLSLLHFTCTSTGFKAMDIYEGDWILRDE